MLASTVGYSPKLSLLRFGALTDTQKERCYFFGSFNPVTGQAKRETPTDLLGHVDLAVAAKEQLGFKEMVFVPVFAAPHKDQAMFATFKQRVKMLWHAFQGYPGLVVSEIEKTLPPPSWTVNTLRALIPGFDNLTEKVPFLIGSDALKGLNTWREGKLLAEKLLFIASPRDGEAVPESIDFKGEIVPLSVELVKGVNSSVSSSTVRENVVEGRSIKGLVAPEVENDIRNDGLFRKPTRLQKMCRWGASQAATLLKFISAQLGFKSA